MASPGPPEAVGRAQRLMITSMTLENFKSYAGEQHIGPFHKVRRRMPTARSRRRQGRQVFWCCVYAGHHSPGRAHV